MFIFHKAEIYIPMEFILRFYYQKVSFIYKINKITRFCNKINFLKNYLLLYSLFIIIIIQFVFHKNRNFNSLQLFFTYRLKLRFHDNKKTTTKANLLFEFNNVQTKSFIENGNSCQHILMHINTKYIFSTSVIT